MSEEKKMNERTKYDFQSKITFNCDMYSLILCSSLCSRCSLCSLMCSWWSCSEWSGSAMPPLEDVVEDDEVVEVEVVVWL